MASRYRSKPAIYGRDRERAELNELLQDACNGHGSLVLIGGEAGIGKTTLVEDLIHEAEQRDCLVLTGGCYDLTTTPPYGPWVEVYRDYRPVDGLPPVPESIRDEAKLAAMVSQNAFFDLVGDFFASISAERPLILVLEDLHWADPATLDLLRFFARRLRRLPVMVVATYRNDEITRNHLLWDMLPLLVRESAATRISLRPLDAADAQALVRDRYGLEAADEARLVEHLLHLSEGNPLFAAELLSGLEEDGTLRRSESGWQMDALSSRAIPPLLRQVIESRLDRLDPDTRVLLELAAIIGHEFSIDIWRGVSHQPAEKLNTATLRAIESNVLQESIDGERLVFRHALIREALYAGIAPLQRRDLHRSVAEALVAEDRPDPDEIVTHLERAFDPRAMLWLVRAGDRAMTRFAWDVGVQRYERALELLERQADPDEALHGEVLLSLGEAQNRVAAGRSGAAAQPVLGAGGSYTGRDTFKRAAAVAARSGSSEQLAQAALGVVGFNPYPQQAGIEGVELLEQALEQLPPQDSLLRVQILARLSIDPYFLAANHERIPLTQELADTLLARSDEAVAMARRLDDRTALAYALVMRVMQHELRPTDEWLAAADEAVEAARAAGDASLLIWALLEKFIATERSGDVDLLRRIVDQIRPISDQLGLPIFDWEVACADAKIALAAGNLDKAERLLDAADSIQPNSGLGTYLRVVLYLEQCRHEELVHLAVQYASLFIETTEQMHVRTLEMVARWQIDPEQVDRDEFTRIATNTSGASGVKGRDYGRALAWLAELCAAIDAVDEAAIVYDALLTVADENVSGATKYTGGSTHQYLGLLATTLERWDAAGEHFEQALARNEEWGYRLHAAYTRYGWATMLLHRGRAGDSSRAHELLNEARAEAREIGSVRLLRRIEELAPSSSGGKMPYPAGLTQREVEVLQQVARGLTDAEIAEELYISPRTVSQHLRNSYNKLGVNNRAEATRFAVEQGIA